MQTRLFITVGLIGIAYMYSVKGIEKSRVSLLNVGIEETKGRTLEKKPILRVVSDGSLKIIDNVEEEFKQHTWL